MRTAVASLAVALVLSAAPLSSQEYGPAPDAATRREILGIREQAWRTWFANDRAGFERVVPDELIALGWDGGPWGDRKQTLGDMTDFATSEMRLTTLEFPQNVFQQYGDAVILYTRFRLVLTDKDGAAHETSGRGTEIFVRRNGRWIHTGWHLDKVAN
ncbi:MAG: DUF4440 domain-containing protein [Gemmatimonadota bacterium]